jgi:apolipoprotein N-acyltransferase
VNARIRRLAGAIILSRGWTRALIAIVAGAASSLAMAPFNAWPILLVTFPVAVWLIDGAAAGRGRGIGSAAAAGWLFGLGYFVPGLYWIGNAFLVDAQTFGWLLPFAVLGLPAYLALFHALGFALSRSIWPTGAPRIIALAACLTIAEWLRGHLLTGFPWNAFGYALTEPLALAQSASLIGIWGLTFVAIAMFASPAMLVERRGARRWLAPLLALGCMLLMLGYGAVRLQAHPTLFDPSVKLRIMQPNVQQDVRFNYSAKAEVMRKYLALSSRANSPQSPDIGGATLLIWPESAFPFFLVREADAMAQIAALLPEGTRLITGAVRPPDASAARVRRAYNSIYAIDHDGSILSVYDKLHLVPFGEYLPLQAVMERLGFEQLTKVQGGFLAGDRRRVMSIPGAPPFLPLICYEAIFPSEIATTDRERPAWVIVVTNDGWFGESTGPYQHLQQTRVRAIEQGLPIVRSANTGISAVIDAVGRNVASLELGTEGVLDARLPLAVAPTVYARVGDLPAYVIIASGVVIALRRRRKSTGR